MERGSGNFLPKTDSTLARIRNREASLPHRGTLPTGPSRMLRDRSRWLHDRHTERRQLPEKWAYTQRPIMFVMFG